MTILSSQQCPILLARDDVTKPFCGTAKSDVPTDMSLSARSCDSRKMAQPAFFPDLCRTPQTPWACTALHSHSRLHYQGFLGSHLGVVRYEGYIFGRQIQPVRKTSFQMFRPMRGLQILRHPPLNSQRHKHDCPNSRKPLVCGVTWCNSSDQALCRRSDLLKEDAEGEGSANYTSARKSMKSRTGSYHLHLTSCHSIPVYQHLEIQ
jgi:hypothetical protein